MIYRESAEAYHARQAVSASFLWDIVKPSGCLAQAWHDSIFNPDGPPLHNSHELDIGTAVHLAVLESLQFAERCSLIAFDNYRTKEARDLRDECWIAGRTPLLLKEYGLVNRLREALEESDAAELLFGAGESEVSFTWSSEGVECKARADRVADNAIIDLKTAVNASDEAFRYACMREGHHLRAAWYLDGWRRGGFDPGSHAMRRKPDYLFIVIGKEPPHLVSVKQLDEQAIEWGRRLYHRALAQFRRGRETGIWSGYNREGEKANIVSLPVSAVYRYRDMDEEGEL